MEAIRNLKLVAAALFLLAANTAALDDVNPFQTSESILFSDLFYRDDYDAGARPVRNKSQAVQVSIDVALVQLVDMNDKDQSLKSNLWIRQSWINELILWNPEDYGGIKSLVVDKKNIWTPDIVLYNNARNGKHSGSMDQFKTRVEITSTGLHKWYIPATLTSSCGIDITFFPFDIQTCPLKFGSWTYLGHELNLTNFREIVDTDAYLPSSSFILREARAVRNVVYYACCTDPYVDVTFELVLERQPGFYLYNVVVPSLVVTGFALLNFMLPDITGSRMGLVFDCFLAITVTYMMVSDMLPVSSDSIALISQFMLFCMSQMVLAVVASGVSMRLRIETPMPKLLRWIVIDRLAPLLFVTPWSCRAKTSNENDPDENLNLTDTEGAGPHRYGVRSSADAEQESFEMLDMSDLSDSSGYPETSDSSSSGAGKRQKGALWDYFSSGFSSLDSTFLSTKSDRQCLRDVESLVQEQQRDIDDCNTKDFWRCVSQVADRVFLITFSSVWLVLMSVLFISTPSFHRTGA